METISLKRMKRLPIHRLVYLSVVYWAIIATHSITVASTGSLFDAPPAIKSHDEIFLISTRRIGTVCNSESMSRGLECQRSVKDSLGHKTWKKSDWRSLLAQSAGVPTVVYAHGNRVSRGRDRAEGLAVYRSLKASGRYKGPVRFVIWSWPSDQIPGPIKDYLVKAQRTNPVAWQLAWFLDKLPVENQVSLVGYSYGTRVVTGATHLLAGGKLGPLTLTKRRHLQRPPMRAALLAAAYDADWLQPRHFYSRSLNQIERLVLGTNSLDPAMRFYHLSNGRGRMDALGKSGVHQPSALGQSLTRLGRVDFTRVVGRSHSLADYLAANKQMSAIWRELMKPQAPSTYTAARPLLR